MNKLQKYIDRITKEWKQHNNLIIAVDFDDTISPWGLNFQDDCNMVIKKLQEYQKQGAYVVIFTACNTNRFEEIRNYCDKVGITISSINKNPFDLPYGNDGKIYANAFLDDRGGLLETLEILDGALANMRSKSSSVDNSEFSQFPYTT